MKPKQNPLLVCETQPGQPKSWCRLPRLPDPAAWSDEHYAQYDKAMANPATRARYNKIARSTGRWGYGLVLDDIAVEPEIERIGVGRSEHEMIIVVNKALMVSVEVEIQGFDGVVLVLGDAKRIKPNLWRYKVPSPMPRDKIGGIRVRLKDLAGYCFWEAVPMLPIGSPENPAAAAEG
jgi:hypothetical protein